jgi:hypothetical protein
LPVDFAMLGQNHAGLKVEELLWESDSGHEFPMLAAPCRIVHDAIEDKRSRRFGS